MQKPRSTRLLRETEPVAMGKQMFHTFKEAADAGPHDERPMLPVGVDPQLHLSRHDSPQPFHLICEKECVLVMMSGAGRVQFNDGPVRWFNAVPGDFIYVPAGMPHRVLPDTACVQYRYKAAHAGLEGVAWFCKACNGEIHRQVWDTADTPPQQGYADACETFDADGNLRQCACGQSHDPTGFDTGRWREIAAEIAEAKESGG